MAIQAISGYELVEVLGEGPRGIVYKARDPKSKGWVALKVFHSLEIADAGKLLQLNHPHIATVHEIGRADSQSFAVIEYLSGGTLKDHIRSMQSVGDVIPAEQILHYAEQIAEALVYAADHGISNSNVKAENVMFTDEGAVKVTDFISTGESSAVDAFARLLYEMATGRSPFPGMAVPPIETYRTDLPAAFSQVVNQLLDHDGPGRHRELRSVLVELRGVGPSQATTRMRSAPQNVAAVSKVLFPGRLLANRFKIVKFIARGGMGEVYEAEDVELHERVALKTIRPEIAGGAQVVDRFKREIQLARRVTHPNVCRIFDLFHDATGSESIAFLTMELLQGETLHQRLSRNGRMSTSQALPIIRQMAAGLAAAHRAGVIHRDLKSSNAMITTETSDGQEFRTVITDFGLARPAEAHESMATLSRPGDVVGTPAYMAPEQFESAEITPATDIYAFGIVMYEMVTGTLPFAGESGLAAALKRLHSPPPSPRMHSAEIDVVWEKTILRCLAPNPRDRFNNVDDVVKALTGEIKLPPLAKVVKKRLQAIGGRRWLPAAAGIAVMLVLLWGALAIRNRWTSTGFTPRRSIAVLGFKNLTGEADAAWLSTALSEMLTTELGAGEKLRSIPGETVARMSVEVSLPESGGFAADTLNRIRNYLGADVIVYGSYVVLPGAPTRIRVDFRLQDSAQGNLLAAVSQEGEARDLLALVSRSGAALREKLGVGTLAPGETEAAQAALPATPEAAQFYAEGLEKLRVFDGLGARAALDKAVATDERYALARAALATAWSMSGYSLKAKEQSKIALDLSSKLSRENQLLVEGRAREAALEWPQAVAVYRTLFGFFPDNLDYGLRLAETQTSAGQAKDGLATIETLRKLPQPDRDSPRIDLAEARAAGALSDFKRQQAMAARAAVKGRERGAKLLVAGAKLIEGSAFSNLGELAPAQTAFEEARELYSAAGDRWDASNALTNLAYVVMQSGDFARAENIYQQSLKTYREVGDRKGEAAVLTSIGMALRNHGDFTKAKETHEQALAIRREIGDRVGEAISRNNLANLLSLMGDSLAAREMYQSALPVFRETGDRNAAATVLSNLGDLVSDEGDLSRARDLYEESRAAFQELGNKSSLAHELSRIGDLDFINADLVSARKKHEEALALRKQLGEKPRLAESQLALAQISMAQQDAISAETAARAAVQEFEASNRPDDEASAMAVLARSLLAQEKYADSARTIQQAEALSMKSNDRSVRLSVAMTGASIRAARGGAAKSITEIEAIIKEARNAKLVQLELEARLALGEIEIGNGRFQAGRVRLDALEAEASKRGYKHIADRAAAAKKKIPAATA